MMHKENTTGLYIYAFIEAKGPGTYGTLGINGAEVFRVGEGVAAVVSPVSRKKRFRPQRANVMAHNAVLRRLMQETTVLPVTLGRVADSTESVLAMVDDHRETFEEIFDEIDLCFIFGNEHGLP